MNEAWPQTRTQHCWVHKSANVLAALPDSIQAKAKYPKAVNILEKDRESLLVFYEFPAEHWVHIRTTNPIESSFATTRHRTTRTKNCVSRNTLLGLVFQLALTAEKSWRKIRGFKQLPDVIKGIRFQDGIAEAENRDENQQIAA